QLESTSASNNVKNEKRKAETAAGVLLGASHASAQEPDDRFIEPFEALVQKRGAPADMVRELMLVVESTGLNLKVNELGEPDRTGDKSRLGDISEALAQKLTTLIDHGIDESRADKLVKDFSLFLGAI